MDQGGFCGHGIVWTRMGSVVMRLYGQEVVWARVGCVGQGGLYGSGWVVWIRVGSVVMGLCGPGYCMTRVFGSQGTGMSWCSEWSGC